MSILINKKGFLRINKNNLNFSKNAKMARAFKKLKNQKLK